MTYITHLSHRARGVFYGWWLVGISSFIRTSSVPLFHAMGLWFVALEAQFGWNRTQLSLAFAFTRVESGLLGPVEGYLTDRIGTRRLVFIGLLVMGAGFLLFGQVNHLWVFYVAFLVMALGQGLSGWLPITTMLNNWFIRRRSSAMGWSNSGSRLGGLLLIPLLAWAIDPDYGHLGWALTASILGIFFLVIALPISRLIRNRPEDYGLHPDGDTPDSTLVVADETEQTSRQRNPNGDFTLAQAMRTKAFWYISVGHSLTAVVIVSMMTHLAPLLTDEGFSLQSAGWVVTVYTAVSMVFQVIGGYAGERIPKNVGMFVFSSIQAGAVLVLVAFPSNVEMVYLFAVLFGIGFGGTSPLATSIRGDYFGRANFGKILGISSVPMNILLFGASPFAGYMYDLQGDYNLAFEILAALNFLGALLLLMAKKPMLRTAAERTKVTRQDS
ncbi:uncharacterized protein METZ01_LOCUS31116 [marine metagenome]|uniref:Major facilitator superfamily (MFS) profile domain-containing protein n=1 Tax=marine metagenome TaxID=408172 RepID=A0A381QG02_9ZZZZ